MLFVATKHTGLTKYFVKRDRVSVCDSKRMKLVG